MPSFEEVAPKLRLLLCGRGDNDEAVLGRALGNALGWPVFMPLGSSAMQQLVIEEEEFYTPVTDLLLAEWTLSADDAVDRALGEITKLGNGLSIDRLGDGLLGVENVDPAIAALLLSTDLDEQLDFEGAPVVLLVDSSTVVIADAENPEELNALLARATNGLGAEDSLPPIPLVRIDGEWRDFEPADGSLALRLRNLKLQWQASEYARQDELIQRLANAAAAPFEVHDVDGTLISATSWIDGVPTFLPDADLVNLGVREGDGAKKVGSVRLRKLLAAVKLTAMELCPVRYFCTAHPVANVLEPLLMKDD